MKRCISLPDLPKGGPYSHSVIVDSLVFVSGQTGQLPDRETSFEEQFTNTISKIKRILEESGSSLDRVAKISVYLSNVSYFQKMNDLFGRYFSNNPPARTTLVTEFVAPGIAVEIDVIATR